MGGKRRERQDEDLNGGTKGDRLGVGCGREGVELGGWMGKERG